MGNLRRQQPVSHESILALGCVAPEQNEKTRTRTRHGDNARQLDIVILRPTCSSRRTFRMAARAAGMRIPQTSFVGVAWHGSFGTLAVRRAAPPRAGRLWSAEHSNNSRHNTSDLCSSSRRFRNRRTLHHKRFEENFGSPISNYLSSHRKSATAKTTKLRNFCRIQAVHRLSVTWELSSPSNQSPGQVFAVLISQSQLIQLSPLPKVATEWNFVEISPMNVIRIDNFKAGLFFSL